MVIALPKYTKEMKKFKAFKSPGHSLFPPNSFSKEKEIPDVHLQ